MYLGISAALFAVFVANVFLGATSGSAFMGDVQEMLTLFAAAIAFTAAILRREALAKKRQETDQ